MDALLTRPWQLINHHSRDRNSRLAELDRVIDGLQKRQTELSSKIKKETGHTRLRRLTLALAAAELQHRKALSLREQLASR